MGRLNITVTGETFTDYPLSSVGASAFRLEHDYFIRQDLVIRDAAGGGGNLLIEDTDYILAGEDVYLSTIVTDAVGSGRNVMLTVQVINAAYQAVPLYFSGKYVADAVEAADFHRVGYAAKSANFTIRKDDGIRTFNVTTGTGGAGDITATLPALDGTNGRICFMKVDTGTNKAILDGNGTEKIGVEGNALTFDLYAQGDWVEVEDMSTYWSVVGTNEPLLRNVITSTQSQATPVANTWYNLGGSLALGPGIYELSWSTVVGESTLGATVSATLSTGPATESDIDLSASMVPPPTAGTGTPCYRKKRVVMAASATYYLNCQTQTASTASISFYAGTKVGNIIIEARRIG